MAGQGGSGRKRSGAISSLDERLERALTRERVMRFQLWQLLLSLMAAVAAAIAFSSVALKGQEENSPRYMRAAHAIVAAPATAHKIITEALTRYHPRLAKLQRFAGETGYSADPHAKKTGDLVALARFDGDMKRGIIEIISSDDGSVLGAWRPDLKEIYRRAQIPEKASHLKRDHSPSRFLPHSPSPEADGSVVFHGMDSPLVKLDVCSRMLWMLDGKYHHSIEPDGEGGNWTIKTLQRPSIDYVDGDFQDDAIVRVSSGGEILFQKSAAEALIKSGYGYIVYSHDLYDPDPLHLNDVEPALTDGTHWRKGDLFLSFRNPSVVALYRPSTDEILWARHGPWMMQHDVDIVSDHEIAVFNNNAVADPSGEHVVGWNDVTVYDFATGAASSPYKEDFKAADIRTKTNGLFARLGDGALMVEEQNYGRLLTLNPDGSERWRYINRAPKDGRVYQLGWSRPVGGKLAASLKDALASADCSGA